MQPKGIEPGIYFDLPAEQYHQDPAISCSGIKNLLVSPMKFWRNSSLNPRKKYKETDAQKMGTALHCYLMEKEKFWRDYIVLPKLEVDSDFYRTESQKPDFLERFEHCKTKDAKTFKYKGGKIVIKEDDFERIKESVEYFESLPTAGELFKDGYMEVSVFWRDKETGLMCKCRFDYLAVNYAADYKSLEKIGKINTSIGEYDYYIQQAFYLEGLHQIKFLEAKVIDKLPDNYRHFAWQVIESSHSNFIFAFQEKEDLLVRLKTFNADITEYGKDLCRRGLRIYKNSVEKYGTAPWSDDYKKTPDESDIEVLGWEDLPPYIQYKYARA